MGQAINKSSVCEACGKLTYYVEPTRTCSTVCDKNLPEENTFSARLVRALQEFVKELRRKK